MSDKGKKRLSIARIVRGWARETARHEDDIREDLFTAALDGQFEFPMSPSDDPLRRFGPDQSQITLADGEEIKTGHLKAGLDARSPPRGSVNAAIWAEAESDLYITREGFKRWCDEHGEAFPEFWGGKGLPDSRPKRPAGKTRSAKRRGRAKGSGIYNDSKPLEKMKELIGEGIAKSPHQAATMVVCEKLTRVKGTGTETSTIKRLYTKYLKLDTK